MRELPIREMEPGEAAECEAILRSLPEWFGIEEAIVEYRRDIETMETCVALQEERIVGFLTLRGHNRYSSEMQVLAVRPEVHRRGIGRALVRHAERLLQERSFEFLQVKTLGPSRENAEYAATRAFYEEMGYRPLEENELWGERNPCLILVKHLPSALRRELGGD